VTRGPAIAPVSATANAAKLASERRNVLVAALLGAKIEDLASDLFLDGCRGRNVGSTGWIFLQFSRQRYLFSFSLAGLAGLGASRTHQLSEPFGYDSEDSPQDRDKDHCENQVQDDAEHSPISILA